MKSYKEQMLENMGLAIDSIVMLDFHSRGIIQPIYACMYKKLGKSLTMNAAAKLCAAMEDRENPVVFIGTGFLIKPAMHPETDGPSATALLARAIALLGGIPVIITQSESLGVLSACCTAAELNVCESLDMAKITPYSVLIKSMPPASNVEGTKLAKERFMEMEPVAMVSIEHPGKGEDGRYYSVMGYELEGWPGDVDGLLEMVEESGGVAIGIGDAGNEAGMGFAKPEINSIVPYGSVTTSKVTCAAPIIASVSEFGAYGLIAAMECVSGRKVLHTPELNEIVVRAGNIAGSVDGCTGRPNPGLDIVDVKYVRALIEMLECVIVCTRDFTATRPFFIDFCRGEELDAPGSCKGGHGR